MDLQRLRSGTLLVVVARAFQGGAGLLATMVMTRLVGTADMGAYFMLAQIVNVSRLFSEAGMNVGLQKLIGVDLAAEDLPAVRRHATAAGLLLVLASAAVTALLAVGWVPLTRDLLGAPAIVGFLAFVFPWLLGFSIEDLASVFFRSLHEIRTAVVWIGVPRQALLLVSLAALWLSGVSVSLWWVLAVVTASWAFSGVVSAGLVYARVRGLAAPSVAAVRADLPSILGLSVPMLLHTGALLVMSSADIWVLQIFRGAADVGIYGAVTRVSVSMAFFVGAVNMVLPPMLARLHAAGRTLEMEPLLRRSAAWGAYLALPMTVVFVAAGGPVLDLAFTGDYAPGAPALAVLAIGHCLNTLAGSPGFVLQMTGSHLFLMRLTVGVSVLNLVGNLLLVGPLGMFGVALSTAVSLIIQNVAMTWVVWRRVGVRTWAALPGLGSAPPATPGASGGAQTGVAEQREDA